MSVAILAGQARSLGRAPALRRLSETAGCWENVGCPREEGNKLRKKRQSRMEEDEEEEEEWQSAKTGVTSGMTEERPRRRCKLGL